MIYNRQVRLNWCSKWLAMPVLLAALGFLGAGCGGINASQSVSPASFFLPGLLKADPPVATNAPVAMNDLSHQLAQAR